MPLIQNRAKSISKRHILGWRDIKRSGTVAGTQDIVTISNDIKTKYIPHLIERSFLKLKAGLYNLRREHRVQSTFAFKSDMPDFSENVWKVLPYSYGLLKTANVNNYRYYSVKEGAYHSSVFIVIKYFALQNLDTVKLAIYKNGEPYKLLDYKSGQYNVTMPNGENKIIALKGAAVTDLKCGDYMDIRLRVSGRSIAKSSILYVYSYWDVFYAGCNFVKHEDLEIDWSDNSNI